MPNSYNESNSDGISKTVWFRIKIEKRGFSFGQYKHRLYEATNMRLARDGGYLDDNFQRPSPLKVYVEELLQRTAGPSKTLSILTSYKESEGSLLITFSYIVFSAFMNYGAFRESLDYVRDDLKYFLQEIFPDDTRINIEYTEDNNRVFTDIRNGIVSQVSSSINRDVGKLNREIKTLRGILLLIGLLAVGFSTYALLKVNEQPENAKFNSDVLNSVVRSEIDKVNAEKVNAELLEILRQKKEDSIRIKK